MESVDRNESLVVDTNDTKTTFSKIDNETFSYRTEYNQERGLRNNTRSSEFTVSGPMWTIVIGESGTGSSWVVVGKLEKSLSECPAIFFIPPFSIIEMRFENLNVRFGGIHSIRELPDNAPNTPTLFDVPNFSFPKNCDDVFELFSNRFNELDIDRGSNPRLVGNSTPLI